MYYPDGKMKLEIFLIPLAGRLVGLGRAGGKRGRRKENMGQSTISEKILIHLIYVLLE